MTWEPTTSTAYSINLSSALGGSASTQYTWVTDTGTEMKVKTNTKGEIGATLYLKYVKSKLGTVRADKAKRRLAKLQKLVMYSKEMGQKALYEELCLEIAVLVREAEMMSFGIDTWIDFEHIDKYLDKVRDKTIKWLPLEKFPRVVPKNVQTKVKALEKAKIFDELWVLFLDYTKQDLKTTKEKIRNKDPILFGKFSHQPDRYYFIADWVDEYCDLTLEKFVESFKADDPEFGVNEVPDIDEDRWKGIVNEVKERQKKLADTKQSNWRELEKAEAEAKTTVLKEGPGTKKWWRRWF
jgi:hypothetical protein